MVREVTQFQFTEWPCYSSPQTGALLHFRRVVADTLARSQLRGPPVVHCQDGGGRSGVFVMLDANIELVKHAAQVRPCNQPTQSTSIYQIFLPR